MCDDLNAPRALAVVWDVVRSKTLPDVDRRALLEVFDEGLGLGLEQATGQEAEAESDPRIDGLLAERQQARAAKDFATADRIRDELAAQGIEIVDTPEGSHWRRR